MEIFRAYDVRGLYPSELDEEKAFRIGRSLATKLKTKKFFVNYDNRLGSIRIKNSFTNGLIKSGGIVYELGPGPVMVSAFASFSEKACGICISASHNPKDYTGILVFVNGVTLFPEKIKSVFDSKKFSDKFGKPIPFMYDEKYVNYITNDIGKVQLKVGIDSMGGATTFIAPHIFQKIGAKTFSLRSAASEDFYGKIPEPSIKNASTLGKLIKKEHLAFGVQLDADGDRALIVDEKGNALDPLKTALILIKNLKYKQVVATTACSSILEQYANVTYVKTGRPNVEIKLKTGKYDFGVEPSSHFYFGKYFPFSDGIVTALLIAKIITLRNKPLSELAKEFPKIYYKESSIKLNNQKEIELRLKKIVTVAKKYGKFSMLDGVKISLMDGFMLFRASNTEPLIRVYYSGHDAKAFKRIGALVKNIIR